MRAFFKVFGFWVALSSSVFGIAADVTPCFSPRQNCAVILIETLRTAQKKIYVHAYTLTHPDIAMALVEAYNRGIDVRIHADKGTMQQKGSLIFALMEAGIPVSLHEGTSLAHNKIMIIDDELVITGSFNWTRNAMRNEENLNMIRSKDVAKTYLKNWKNIAGK